MRFHRVITTTFLALICTLPLQGQAAIPVTALQGDVPTLAPMLKTSMPAVVNIATSGTVKVQNPLLDDPFFREFFFRGKKPQAQERKTQSIGSGVIVDAKKGYVLTNQHVIDNADEIFVVLQDNRRIAAKLIGSDKATDVAVLQIEAKNLVALPMSNSDAVEVGDFAVAIGNPVGLGHTVTSGIISAVGRSGLGIEEYEDFIQTDASINPGNSGGALINLKGELIGINTAIYSRTGGNIGIGFAIPVNMARSVMDQLLEHGEIKRGMLGVQIQDLTPELAEAMDVNAGSGALISSVVEGSAAFKAGLKEGDIITAIDNIDVTDASTLRNRVGLKRIGETITLAVLRDGKAMAVKATIGDMPEAAVATEEDLPRLAGAHFGAGIPDNHPLLGSVEGVYISDVEAGSAAWRAGLRPGDVIVSVNKKAVKSVKELAKLAGKDDDSRQYQRPGQSAFMNLHDFSPKSGRSPRMPWGRTNRSTPTAVKMKASRKPAM